MKTSPILMAVSALALMAAAPAARAQVPPPRATVVVPDSGNWTLKQRENWLKERIEKARHDKDIDGREAERVDHELDGIRHDEDRLRDSHHGQLTDNETAMLEARLDGMADKIQWLHENAYQRPW